MVFAEKSKRVLVRDVIAGKQNRRSMAETTKLANEL
jgi:hypothetical protein